MGNGSGDGFIHPLGDALFVEAETFRKESGGFIQVHPDQTTVVRGMCAMLDLAPLEIASIIAHIEIVLPVSVKHHFVSAARANHLYNLQTFQKALSELFVI